MSAAPRNQLIESMNAEITGIAGWLGGKRTMARRIARECCRPDGRAPKAFWDLCCGSLAVSLAMPPCSHHHAVDLHEDLVNLARVIQDRTDGPIFYRRLRRVLCHETLFREAKAALEADDRRAMVGLGLFDDRAAAAELTRIERAIAYFICAWMGRNGVAGTKRVNYQPAIRWTSGGGHNAVRVRSAVDSIPAWRKRMRTISVIRRDIFKVLPKIADEELTTIYVDPSYLRDGARTGSCTYLHEFKPADHERLAKELRRFKLCRVVVSYYEHDYLRELYSGWTFVDCMTQKNLHVQNRRGVGRCEAPEVLIINGPSYTADAVTISARPRRPSPKTRAAKAKSTELEPTC